MKDYIFRLQFDISKGFLLSFSAVVLALYALPFKSIDLIIFVFGIVIWFYVLVETVCLMLPESDEPYDWQ